MQARDRDCRVWPDDSSIKPGCSDLVNVDLLVIVFTPVTVLIELDIVVNALMAVSAKRVLALVLVKRQ
jgi:hypothetical protein